MCAFGVREILQIKNAPFVLHRMCACRIHARLCTPQWNIKASSHIKLDPYIIGCVLQVQCACMRGQVQYFIKPLSSQTRPEQMIGKYLSCMRGCCCEATLFSLLPFLRSHVGEKIIGGGSFNNVHASKWGGKHAGKLSAAFHATLWSWCLEANSEFHTERLQHICEQISNR